MKYIVENGSILHDGKIYEVGETIELTEEQFENVKSLVSKFEEQIEEPQISKSEKKSKNSKKK